MVPVERCQIRVEPDLICGASMRYALDVNSKRTASCSIVRFLRCFGRAVEVRIVIYLSVLGRMKNEFSVNSDDVEKVCVGAETVLLSGEADLV